MNADIYYDVCIIMLSVLLYATKYENVVLSKFVNLVYLGSNARDEVVEQAKYNNS